MTSVERFTESLLALLLSPEDPFLFDQKETFSTLFPLFFSPQRTRLTKEDITSCWPGQADVNLSSFTSFMERLGKLQRENGVRRSHIHGLSDYAANLLERAVFPAVTLSGKISSVDKETDDVMIQLTDAGFEAGILKSYMRYSNIMQLLLISIPIRLEYITRTVHGQHLLQEEGSSASYSMTSYGKNSSY